jgi:YD repeat-containing protein
LVKSFIDEKPNGGVLFVSSSDGGNINVRTVYDEKGKLTGVEIAIEGV